MRSSQVEIASPCHESWDAMNGDAERRYCGVCAKHVHDLSAMRHDDAQALLRESAGGHLCVRYTVEGDGSLRFRDLVPRASLTRKIVRTAFAAVMLAACTPYGDGPPIENIGDAVIDSVRQDTVPSADGGCDYQSGPFTTVHLPPGHLLCQQNGQEVAQPPEIMMGKMPAPEPPEPKMGEAMPVDLPQVPPPPVVDLPQREIMGAMVANPEPVDPFVPCDPKPGFAPPPPPDEVHELMGDIAAPTPPTRPQKLMGKPTYRPPPEREDRPQMGQMMLPHDE